MKVIYWTTIVLCLAVLFIFRAHDYGRYPFPGHADELNYGWAGVNLIREGQPLGWTGHKAYPSSWIAFDGVMGKGTQIQIGVKMYKPWLDEPPLYSLLAGSMAYWYNDPTWTILPASHIRIPAIFFGFATTLLLFFWARRWYGTKMGLLVATIYTLTPIFLFGSRLSLPENGISFLYVLGLFLLSNLESRHIGRWKYFLPIGLGVLAGLAGLMKPTGFFIAGFFAFIFIIRNQVKKGLLTLLIVVPFVVGLLGYYTHFGGQKAWEILRIQGFRPSGWSSLGYVFSTPLYSTSNEPVFDGWYVYLLFMSFIVGVNSYKDKRIAYLVWAIVFWFGVVVMSSGEQDPLAWYRYPVFPLLAFLGSIGLVQSIKSPNLLTGFMAVGMWLSSRFFVHNAFMATTDTYTFKVVFGLLMVPFIWLTIKPSYTAIYVSRAVLVGVLMVGLYLNARYIYSVFPITCESITCPIQVGTPLSDIRLPILWRFFIPKQYVGLY